jgi:RimJ/RimL family protein N-acetyltransferase
VTTLRTDRLLLRPFRDEDLAPFAALNSHPAVVEWLGSNPTRAESDALAARLSAELKVEGWGFWALEVIDGAPFVGMCGLHRVNPVLPSAPAVEVGWRLSPEHWGSGYATEAAAAALGYGFTGAALPEIVAFTARGNERSQAVMARVGMVRDPAGDFDHPSVATGSPLRHHVLYRVTPAQARAAAEPRSPSQAPFTVEP